MTKRELHAKLRKHLDYRAKVYLDPDYQGNGGTVFPKSTKRREVEKAELDAAAAVVGIVTGNVPFKEMNDAVERVRVQNAKATGRP